MKKNFVSYNDNNILEKKLNKKSTWISFEELKQWRDEINNKNVPLEKKLDKNLYKSNWISPEELKKSKEYIDEIRKRYPNINFEKNTNPYTGSSHRRISTL